MFSWSPEMLRFYKDASESSEYHAQLSEKIAARIDASAHICDAGCGLGYLSLELAKRFHSVSAVDVSSEALKVLRENCARFKLENIRIVEGDIFKVEPKEPYDAMVFCFFGRTAEALSAAKTQCSGKALLIKKNWETHRFDLGEAPVEGHTFLEAQKELQAWGIPFESETFELSFGQPFSSAEDALTFFQIYAKGREGKSITLEEAEARLIRTQDATYPYFLSSLKRMGMLIVDVGDIPVDIHKKLLGEESL